MRATEFQMEILGRIADDYEAVHTIRGDIERDFSLPVSDEEVFSALVALVALGFADPFVYDVANSKYRRVAVEGASIGELWFLISEAGRLEDESFAV